MTYDPVSANPLAGNPLRDRTDVERALRDLFRPLIPYFSEGGARVRLSAAAAHFDRAAADLEGFARPLWGLAPFTAGGSAFEHWPLYRAGLTSGTDPAHPEYWGAARPVDQRLVELAAIGFALRLIPETLWEPLPGAAKANLARYLTSARDLAYAENNWKFFRVLVDLGLEQVGVPFDPAPSERFLDELDGFYIGDGWYRDGNCRRLDHYIAFAMHFYGLIYARLKQGDDERRGRYRERARLFAQDFAHWFDEDGGVVAFGRSMTYRFACAAFWGALAFAGEEALAWGEIKGLYLRHLRWWAKRPIANRDGVLSIGFGYPNLMMSESYNSAGSPYWALKAFLPLALPAGHPFWLAEEAPPPPRPKPRPMRRPGMVAMATRGNVVLLASGQENLAMRMGAEKYAKFAYSSRYGFSVEADERGFAQVAADGMIAFSGDCRHYRVRESNEKALIAGNALFARWRPYEDVVVETWLLASPPWHIRIHRVTTPRPLLAAEGGFAVSRADGGTDLCQAGPGRAEVIAAADRSVIVDLVADTPRAGRVIAALPNTNLIVARTLVPQLRGEIPAGTSVLAAAVLALPSGPEADAAAASPPALPDIAALEALFVAEGQKVDAMDAPGTLR